MGCFDTWEHAISFAGKALKTELGEGWLAGKLLASLAANG